MAQLVVQGGFESFLTGLGRAGEIAEDRAAMMGQAFQIDHLFALGSERVQQGGLAGPRLAVDQHDVRGMAGLQRGDHLAPPGAITALDQRRLPAHRSEHQSHGLRPHAAAPAIDQRFEVLGAVCQRRLQVPGDIARDQGRAHAPRLEGGDLGVVGADAGAFGVVQNGQVDGAGQVVLGKLGRGAHIDDDIEAFQFLRR